MPYWYYEKKELRHTPSINQGLPYEQEILYRREGARFILQVGNKMGLRYETMATGVVYFHRFYMVHNFQEFPRHVTACCCLFLAGKVEETPKKCKDIMKTARGLMDDTTWAEFGSDPREEVMTLERILLQTIKFDFIVEHPYAYLLKYAKCLKGDSKKIHNMVQMAWTFVNDSLFTTLCLQWEPEIIAIALMYLAGKLNKFEVTDWHGKSSKHQKWWDMFVQGISLELLEDVCHQVLDLYAPNKAESAASAKADKSDISSANIAAIAKQAAESSSKAQATSPAGPPPAKKVKKEETKSKEASPAKTDSATTQSYQYSAAYNNFAPSYPPPLNSASVAAAPRYAYPYQSSTSHPPPAPSANTSHPPTPTTYQPPPRYPPSIPSTTAPPSTHYSASSMPPHYSAVHPSAYAAAGSATLYSSTTTASHPSAVTHHPSPPLVLPPHHQPTTSHHSVPGSHHASAGAPAVHPPAALHQPPPHHHPSAPPHHPPPLPTASHHPASATHHPAPGHHAGHHPAGPPPHHAPPPPTNFPPLPHGTSSSYYQQSSAHSQSSSYQQSYGSSSSYMHGSRNYYQS